MVLWTRTITGKRLERPGVRNGYDLWAETNDATPNPLVALDRRVTLETLNPHSGEWVLDGCAMLSRRG